MAGGSSQKKNLKISWQSSFKVPLWVPKVQYSLKLLYFCVLEQKWRLPGRSCTWPFRRSSRPGPRSLWGKGSRWGRSRQLVPASGCRCRWRSASWSTLARRRWPGCCRTSPRCRWPRRRSRSWGRAKQRQLIIILWLINPCIISSISDKWLRNFSPPNWDSLL